MSETLNLNSFPYFDDFDESKNYKKVLFKPGVSVQARELTTLQSSIQNQLETFSDTAFFDGQIVEGGSLNYLPKLDYVLLEDTFNGVPVSSYLDSFNDLILVGEVTGVKARVISVVSPEESDRGKTTLYVKYLTSNSTDFTERTFRDSEQLITLESVNIGSTVFFENTPMAKCISTNATGLGSGVKLNLGKTYIRGFFVDFDEKLLILDQYGTEPSYKVGFEISERIITSLEDSSLNDNARGFSNFSAPGADRLQISCELEKKAIDDLDTDTFIEILRLESGKLKYKSPERSYSFIEDELARRTYDESGDYIVDDFDVQIDETLNDLKTSNGIYLDTEKTYKNNEPSEDLVSISISPGKAYVRGYEIEKISNTIFEVEKARDSKLVKDSTIPVNFGKKIVVNNIGGLSNTGITSYYAEFRNRRKDGDHLSGSGTVVGYGRIYDTKLRETYGDDSSEQDLYIYDLQFLSELVVSSDIVSYQVGSLVEGKNSGAIGYIAGTDGLETDPSGVSTFTVYRVSGNFIPNEPYLVDGDLDARLIKTVTNFSFDDTKSIRMVGSGVTYTADLMLTNETQLGDFGNTYNITARNSETGISTITSTDNRFTRVKENDIIKYTLPGISTALPTLNRVVSVDTAENKITVSQVEDVVNFCDGDIPSASATVNDLVIARPGMEVSSDPGLFASIPEELVSDVDIDSSIFSVRKEYNVNIANSSGTINEGDANFAFVGYGIDKYTLVYSDGTVEPLTSQKIVISGSSRQLDLRSLTKATDTGATLIATLDKRNLTTTGKTVKGGTTFISRSTSALSGSAKDTLYDGLTPDVQGKYGTRVQDKDICLNYPDVIRVNAVLESEDLTDPLVPTVTLTNNTSSLLETIPGEEIVGESSGAVAKVIDNLPLQTNTTTKVNFVYLNSRRFSIDEKVTFKSTNITGTVQSLTFGSRDVTSNFGFDSGQRDDYYDFGRIIRNKTGYVPARRLLVVFDRYDLSAGTNNIVNYDSYAFTNFESDILSHKGKRNTDILDFRPRVAVYNINTAAYGPFHFQNRDFSSNSSDITIIDDESITLDYSFYLPRIDKIFLDREGNFNYKKGISAVAPQAPFVESNSMDLFTLYYPAYTFDKEDINIDETTHKRYTMKDLRKIESRIENLERFTTLSLLESEVNSLKVVDDQTGVDKFKTGFIVDSFIDETSQNVVTPYNNISIDTRVGELRPATYTTALDLIWGSKSYIGIGTVSDQNVDLNTAVDLESNNLKKTGNLVTLDYTTVNSIEQPYANRSLKINETNITNYVGNLKLYPSTDSWFDQNNYKKTANSADDPFYYKKLYAKGVENSNFFENRFHSWKDFWTGRTIIEDNKVYNGKIDPYFWKKTENESYVPQKSPIQAITLNSEVDTQNSKTIEKKLFNKNASPYMRRRNFSFDCDSLKPSTRFYGFLDKISIKNSIIPKLLEITMISGSFSVGEDVVGTISLQDSKQSSVKIKFRLATTNHRDGTYNNPTGTYAKNPYTGEILQSDYSQTSTVLNVDLSSLSSITLPEYYGYVTANMTLVGQTSGAKATVKDPRLVSNENGLVQAAFYISKYEDDNKVFLTGKKTLKITSDEFDQEYSSDFVSFAEIVFVASGHVPIYKNDILSIRNSSIDKLSDRTNTASGNFILDVYKNNEFTNNILLNNGFANPLAQLFSVDEPSGIFATSIDVYFSGKDADIPVTLDIKTVKNRVPTSVSVPLSKKTLYPTGISTSSNSTTPTTFEFDSPVFLEGGKIYSIMLSSDSEKYEVYASDFTGGLDLVTSSEVNKVSSVGELYVPGNVTQVKKDTMNLKFKLNKAKFTNNSGALTFYNPKLDFGNNQRPTLTPNPLVSKSNKQIVGLNTYIATAGIATLGLQLTQNETQSGYIVDTLGIVGVGTSSLTVSKVGTGLTPTSGIATYSGVTFTSSSGKGTGLTGDVTVDSGSVSLINITNGGEQFSLNEVVTATLGNTGIDFQFSVGIRTSISSLVLDDVQGTFNSVDRLITKNVATGATTEMPQVIIPDTISQFEDDEDGLHFLVNHKNHGQYSRNTNKVTLSNIESDLEVTTLSSDITATATSLTIVSTDTDFGKFEGIGIGSTNVGYIQIGEEIISYGSINGNDLSDLTRGVDSTVATSHSSGDYISKYEVNGVSLRRMNKSFVLDDVTTNKVNTGNQYYLNVDMSSNGTNRDGTGGYPKLFFNKSKDIGGSKVETTQNVTFNSITPNVQTFIPSSCDINASLRTVTGTSEDGSEVSYVDKGYEAISLNETNNFDDPRLVASRINENQYLTDLPGNKSLTLRLDMSSDDENLSPVVDLERCNVILVNNSINNPIANYKTDSRVNSLDEDPHEAVYISKVVDLQIPSNGLKVIFDAYKPLGTDIKVLHRLIGSEETSEKFTLFPGYNNLDILKNVINEKDNDGSSDYFVNFSNENEFKEHEFTIQNTQSFSSYVIKIVMTSTNSSVVPKIRNLRAISLT